MGTLLITYWFEVLLFIMTAVPSIILFVIKGRISHWFAKDLKKYQQQLDLLKMQKQLQYSNVYVERATIIRNLYRMLGQIIIAQKFTRETKFENIEKQRESYLRYGEYLSQFYEYFMLEGIYLPQTTADKLGFFGEAISKEIAMMHYNLGDKSDEVVAAINQTPNYDLQAIFKALRSDFQTLLGIEEK